MRQKSWRQWFEHRGALLEAIPHAGHHAAAFPEVARQNGAKLIIVNQQATEIDSAADLVIHAGIGQTMEVALG